MTEEVFLKHFETFHQDYSVDLFGGEPLLNWELVKFITQTCVSSRRVRCMGINLYSNGLLLDQDKVDFIKRNEIKFFWSYDGLWCDYEPELKFVKQLTDKVSVQIGPPNLNIVDNYRYYTELGFTPSFSLVRDNIWKTEDIQKFKVEFEKLCSVYINDLQRNHNYLPDIIRMTLSKLHEGLINKKPYLNCGAGERMLSYMPDGSVFPCVRFGTLEHTEDVEGLFEKCVCCHLNNFCDKGCYHQAVLNRGPVDSICKLYKIITNEVMNLNKRLKENGIWQVMVKEMIER